MKYFGRFQTRNFRKFCCYCLVACTTGLIIPLKLAAESQTVTLREPPPHKYGQFTKALLTALYQRSDMALEFVPGSGVRELAQASSGQLSGALARDPYIEEIYPQLRRINVPLFSYRILLIGDRRQCGYCLPEQLTSVLYPRSGKVYQKFVQQLPPSVKVTSVDGAADLQKMLLAGRTNAILISDFNLQDAIINEPNFVIHEIEKRYDYHYIGPQLASSHKQLEQELLGLINDGHVAKLKQLYGIKSEPNHDTEPFEQARAVAGEWLAEFDLNGGHHFWRMLDLTLGSSLKLEKEVNSWVRSLALFETQKADILVGAYHNEPAGYLPSRFHIDYEDEVVLVARERRQLDDFFDAGRPSQEVCTPQWFDVVNHQEMTHHGFYPANIDTCAQLFAAGRINYIIEYPYNLPLELQSLPKLTLKDPLPVFVLFHNNAKGRGLKALFDARMEQVARDGQLRTLFNTAAEYRQARVEPVRLGL